MCITYYLLTRNFREELKQRISGRGLSWEDLMGSCSVTPPLIYKKRKQRWWSLESGGTWMESWFCYLCDLE